MNGELKGPEYGHPENRVANSVRGPDGDLHYESLAGNTTCCGNGGRCAQLESKKSRLVDHHACATQMDFGSVVETEESKLPQRQVEQSGGQRCGRECSWAAA